MNKFSCYYTDLRELFSFFNQKLGARNYIVFSLHLFGTFLESLGILLVVPMLILGVKKSLPDEMAMLTSQDVTGLVGYLTSLSASFSGFSLLLLLCALFLGKAAFLFLSMCVSGFYRAQLYSDLKHDLLKGMALARVDYLNTKNSGHLVNLFNEQIIRSQTAYSSFMNFLTGVVTFSVYFLLLWSSSWTFALFAIVLFLAAHYIFFVPQRLVKIMSRRLVEGSTEFNKKLFIMIHSVKYFKSTNRFYDVLKVIAGSIEALRVIQFKMGVAYSLSYSIRDPLIVVFLMICIYFELSMVGSRAENLAVSVLLLHRCATSAMTFQANWQSVLETKGSIEILQKEICNLNSHAEKFDGAGIPNSLQIDFKNISFSHHEREKPILTNLNFSVPHNSLVAFVGDSGGGKTTVLDLICMVYEPTDGQILFDGIDSKEIDKLEFRKKIGYVTQDSTVFDGTIAENIALGLTKEEVEDPQIKASINSSITMANLDQFVASLPFGIQTQVGDKGVSLSGGQRQRLFIARELFRKPRLLILDEATSAQDAESERLIQQQLTKLKGNISIIVVSHKISSIKSADIIYVLENGEIAEMGNFNELIATPSGIFSKMAMKQRI
jgi:subfamily B ATP-binding cassette protein MsbA